MKLRVGIVGLGNIGSIHHRIYNSIKGIGKIYCVDTNPKVLSQIEEESFTDYRLLLGKVDLISIAVPTPLHYEIASFFLQEKIPVLLEKPMTDNVRNARRLLELSRKKNTLLFVGHVERYNNAYLAAKRIMRLPKFIECHRLSSYPNRSLDVSVVLDLMIHDLDIILDMAKDSVSRIDAKGVQVLSPTEDIANVRLTFLKGCVANVTASRISAKRERKIRVFVENCYISIDYARQSVEIYQKKRNTICRRILPIDKEQPLQKEIREFVSLVRKRSRTLTYARNAFEALSLALRIQRTIENEKHRYRSRR